MVMLLSLPICNFGAKEANRLGLTEATNTPLNTPCRKIGRVNWMDHFPDTLPLIGLLINRLS